MPVNRESFHGYSFRVVAEKSAGAALLAFPAEYRVSGVMTVLLTSSGAVDEKEIIASLNRMYGPAMPMDEVFA